MNTEKIYNQLTNIDISKQKMIWDDRGKGYYGEYLVFCELYKKIQGTCKILMNINIPTENGKTTEIDLLMIHETGIYVFEIKHYKGTIYGKDTDTVWTQYFRTTKNSHFKNPMLQNDYHINAIKKLYPKIPIKSIIVFTNNECTIKVTNANKNTNICTLNEILRTLEKHFITATEIYTMEEIDSVFKELAKYSQMNEPIIINDTAKTFNEWLQPTINKLEINKEELEKEKDNLINKTNELNKAKKTSKLITIITIILCIFVSVIIINNIKNNYYNELSKFKQNFLHVDEIDNEYINNLNEYITISNQSLTALSNNSVSFKVTLTTTNDIYGIALNKNSKYIVMTSSNKVYEYDVFGDHLYYNRYYNIIGKGIRESGELKQAQFFGITKDEITYIKLTNIEMFKLDINKTTIKDKLELELYKKQ